MKIIQVIPALTVGGAEIMCENLSYELKKKGHDVAVVSLYSMSTPISERLLSAGIKVIFLDKKRGLDFSTIKKLRNLLKKENPDVIHTHLYALKYAFMSMVLSKKVKIVHTVHNVATKESTKIDRIMNKWLFHRRRAIPVALSAEIQNTICDLYKLKELNVPIVFNGINLEKCIVKEEYGKNDMTIITHVGRFSKQKNHIELINSFTEYLKYNSKCELWLIGVGETYQSVKDAVAANNISEHVKFLGQQDNVYSFLNKSDIFILPSLYEGVPMSLIEAMGTGLPIIVSGVGGVVNMVENNISALIIKPIQSEIVDALSKLIPDNDLQIKLGKNALKNSVKFSSTEMAKKYIDIYSQQRN